MRPAQVPAQLKQAPFRGSAAVADGLLTRRQLQSGVWRHITRDVYVWSGLAPTPLMAARGFALTLPDNASFSGPTAALIHGIDVGRRRLEVTIPVDGPIRSSKRLIVRRRDLAPADCTVVKGLRVTSPVRTAFDVACTEPLVDAVVVIDAFLTKGLLGVGDLSSYATQLMSPRCTQRATRACELSTPGAESAMETRQRLVIVLGGLPVPVCQYVVTDDCGAFLARVDLAYPELKIAIEYDGADHDRRRADDRWRDNLLVAAGWTVLHFRARDIYRFPERVVEQVGAAIAAATASR